MLTEKILNQIDLALEEWKFFSANSKNEYCSHNSEEDAVMLTNRLSNTIKRLAPTGSIYIQQLEKTLNQNGHVYIYQRPLVGLLSALRRDYELGYLESIEELIHANTFSDFIEMATHLLKNGYKDPAAVIAGSTLEQHLRELCNKHNIAIENNGKPKKSDGLNSELVANSVYSKLDQKSVTSWLGLRNDAAHGNYNNYTKEQVQLMIDSIRDFLARHSA